MVFKKSMLKMDKEELRLWLHNRKRASVKPNGKIYNRAKFKKGM